VGELYPVGHWRVGEGYALVVPVSDRAGVHGRLQVNYSGARLSREALALALETLVLSIIAMLLAWFVANRLRSVLTAPVAELERATQRVRDTGDYGVRARRISQDELGRLTDDFNQMLAQIESSRAALLQAQQRAEESSRLKDEFVATLSHELRTPLSPIMAWIHMLRMPRGAAELPKGLDVMERNAQALIRIIDDLLDMSRIVSGTMQLNMQPVDIDAIIRAAVETLAPAAANRGQRVTLRLASPPPLRGDPARLQQVVWNLLSNALKFSPDGARVSITTVRGERDMRIIVEDEGLGIDPAFLPFAFDRFRQQDGSITRSHGGLGLGLSIVRQLVELHGGSVRAESEGPGRGSTFVVCLPVADSAGRSASDARLVPSAAVPRLDGITVLVVEDHADMRALIRCALEDAGAAVRESASADEAIASFQAHPADVLVSDIGLPDLDGYELLRQLRRSEAGRALPAVAVTAYVRAEEQRRAREAGYQLHLSKPVQPAELVAAVAAARGRPVQPAS
jgi:signal transduction histidine kinase/ActR/RegA family two-component response regulator